MFCTLGRSFKNIKATNTRRLHNLFSVQSLLTPREKKKNPPQAVHSITYPVLMCSLMNKHISGPVNSHSYLMCCHFPLLVNIHACIVLISAAASTPWETVMTARRPTVPLEERPGVSRLSNSCQDHNLSCSCRPLHSGSSQTFSV